MLPTKEPDWHNNTAGPPLWLLAFTGLVLGCALVTLIVTDTPRILWVSLAVVLVGSASAGLIRWFQSWR